MPFSNGYGVVVGSIENYFRDDPDNFGRYYHTHIVVSTAAGAYQCAIDVDSHQSNTGVEWRTVGLNATELGPVVALGVGFHSLASASTSGAIDYIRSPMFASRIGCLVLIEWLLGRRFDVSSVWKRGTSVQALTDLEPLVDTTRNGGLNAMIFGEPFTSGLGIHNIHQNQGDPAGSMWYPENGTWQDGCTILQQSADTYVAFLNKFTTQSYPTDSGGHPA